MIMKKSSLFAVTLGLLASGMTNQIVAQDCGTNYSNCCNTSYCDGKFKVGAEWLYWKGEQDNMVLAQTVAGSSDNTTPAFLLSDTCDVQSNYKYTNGFRINVGYELPCNGWEANVIYTNLPIHAQSKTINAITPTNAQNPGSGPYFIIEPNTFYLILQQLNEALRLALPSNSDFQTFQQKWNLNLNQVDLDIGRTICFNDCISIRPHAGFRALWYTDKQRAVFTGTSSFGTEDPPTSTFESNVSFKDKFTGYGVEAGLWGTWQIGGGVSLIGHFGGSILYSKFVLNEDIESVVVNTFTEEPSETIPFTTAFTDTNHAATPTVDYFLGLEYADVMCDMSFAIRAGWEQHVYFETNRFFQAGNLSTQGLTLGLEVGF